nr:MAG TPA: hypothetical protein [Caudoviricetes sp.]
MVVFGTCICSDSEQIQISKRYDILFVRKTNNYRKELVK